MPEVNNSYIKRALHFDSIQSYWREFVYSCILKNKVIFLKIWIIFASKTFFKLLLYCFRIYWIFFHNCFSTLFELWDDWAFFIQILHILPPLNWIQFVYNLLSNLLIEDLFSSGWHLMNQIFSTVFLIKIAVIRLTIIITWHAGINKGEIYALLYQWIVFSKVFDKPVWMSVIYVEEGLLAWSQNITFTLSVFLFSKVILSITELAGLSAKSFFNRSPLSYPMKIVGIFTL